ncbi:MAG: zinc ribbon domain-containing protein [Clostridiales bacterium]|nr:zinc ribbon domain-containing protein [Clostridiales bacterium]
MAFCSNCGFSINDGLKFCSNCGAPVGGISPVPPVLVPVQNQYQSPQQIQMMQQQSVFEQTAKARMDSLNEMNNMLSYFGQMAQQYDEYDHCNKMIPILQRGVGKARLVWGIIFCCIGAYIGLMTLMAFASSSSRGSVAVALAMIFFAACFIIPGVLMIVSRSVAANKKRKELENMLNREAELATILTQHYNNYGFCLIGAEYTNPKILSRICDIIRSGRADTPKEAINILLDDAHKSMMQLQSQLTMQATRQAARGATAAAVFSAANFFFR